MDRNAAKEQAIRLARRYIDLDPVYFDTETTGLGPNAEIVDIAIVDRDGKLLFQSLVKPVYPIEAKAAEITGISDETVKNSPSILDVLSTIRSTFRGRVVGAYNADFDFRLLHSSICIAGELKKDKHVALIEFDAVFDVIRIGALYYGEWNPQFRNYKNIGLGKLAAAIGVPTDSALHRAAADAAVTAAVMAKIAADPAVERVDESYFRKTISDAIDRIKELSDGATQDMETIAFLRNELESKKIIIDARQAEINRLAENAVFVPAVAAENMKVTLAGLAQDFRRDLPDVLVDRIESIVRSNPYMLTRSDWETVYNFLKPIFIEAK